MRTGKIRNTAFGYFFSLWAAAAVVCSFCLCRLQAAESSVVPGFRQVVKTTVSCVYQTCFSSEIEQANAELKNRIEKVLEDYGADSDLVGIDIRSLDGLYSYTLNENDIFFAASLYKLPLAMIYYDEINAGEMNLDDTLLVTPDMSVEEFSSYYSELEVEYLLNSAILISSNLAGHVLYESLGGWEDYKLLAERYSENAWDFEEYLSEDNITTARFMSDVLVYLAEHQDEYQTLLENMKESEPDNYLNYGNDLKLYQKYGAYEDQINGAGLSLDGYPFVITVLCSYGWGEEELLGEIAKEAYDFMNSLETY